MEPVKLSRTGGLGVMARHMHFGMDVDGVGETEGLGKEKSGEEKSMLRL